MGCELLGDVLEVVGYYACLGLEGGPIFSGPSWDLLVREYSIGGRWRWVRRLP